MYGCKMLHEFMSDENNARAGAGPTGFDSSPLPHLPKALAEAFVRVISPL